jgi:hypothetical protein
MFGLLIKWILREAGRVKDTVFWDASPGSLVDKNMEKEAAESPKRHFIRAKIHSAISRIL